MLGVILKLTEKKPHISERGSGNLSDASDSSDHFSIQRSRQSWLRLAGRPGRIIALMLGCYFLFFFRIGARDLWTPDEPRYAQVAREMLETGEWVVPHLNGEVYTEKPPLYFWLIALLSKPFGDVSEVTARLPSALASTFVVLLTYFLGAKMFGRREAFIGSAVMATSTQFFWIGRAGALDMVLTLSVLAALAVFYIAYAERRPLLYSAAFVLLVPGVLTKGPVALAVALVVMLAFLLTEVFLGKEGAKKQLAWFAVSTVVGLATIALVVVPWWREAHERSGGAYGSVSILIKQTKGRMIEAYSHKKPFYYYFGEIIWQFLPWTVFLPMTIHTVWRKGGLRQNQGLRFLVVWFISVFLFFTCISGKRSQYLLPLFPAGGLILGWALTVSNPFEGRIRKRKAFWVPLLALALGAAAGLVAVVVGAYLLARQFVPPAMVAAFVAGMCLALIVRQCLARPPSVALGCVAAITALAVSVFFGYIGPAVDKYKSARPFCDKVLDAMDEGDALVFYSVYRPNIHYYMRRRMPRLDSNEEVATALEQSPRVFFVLQRGKMGALQKGVANDMYEIEDVLRARVGSRDMLCVTAYPKNTSQ